MTKFQYISILLKNEDLNGKILLFFLFFYFLFFISFFFFYYFYKWLDEWNNRDLILKRDKGEV